VGCHLLHSNVHLPCRAVSCPIEPQVAACDRQEGSSCTQIRRELRKDSLPHLCETNFLTVRSTSWYTIRSRSSSEEYYR
jgi:hypothetical protein